MRINAVGQRHDINFKAHVDLGRARQILPIGCSNKVLEGLYVDTKNIDSFYGKGDFSWNECTIVNLKNGKSYEVSKAVDSIEGLIDEVTRRFVDLGRARQISPKGCSNEVLEGLYVDIKNIDTFHREGDYPWNERTIVNLKNGKAYEVTNAVDKLEGLIDDAKGIRPRKKETYYGGFY